MPDWNHLRVNRPHDEERAGRAVFSGLVQDLKYAGRTLRHAPGFAATAIFTLALGIGATTLLFSVVDGVLLKPLPWHEAERLMRVTETRQGRTARVPGTVSNGSFLAWRQSGSTIEDIGGWLTQTSTLTGAGEAARLAIVPTTPSLFPILGVTPLLGRWFDETEGEGGQTGVIILSYGLWQERFGSRHDVLGRVVRLDEQPYSIVGVMPRGFAFPDRETAAWTAWSVPAVTRPGGGRAAVIFRAIARLREGATPAQAAAEATARARTAPDLGLAAVSLFGAAGPIEITVVPELDAMTADVRPALLVLLASATLLLATATASIAGLQLARATTRRREMAVRAALGAGQPRILRLLAVENALVGLCGAAAGLALAGAFHGLLPWLLPAGFPRLNDVSLDLRTLSFAFAVAFAASMACGLLPAWHARRLNLIQILAEDGSAPVGGALRSRTARMRGVIMAGQVAIACVLLVGAALLTRSFVSLTQADRGYDPANVLTARLPFPPSYPGERRLQLLDAMVERLHAVPGVTHAAYSTALPLLTSGGFTAFRMRSLQNPEVEIDVQAAQRVVTPEYFGAMGLRLVAGRLLSEADSATSRPALVVNRTFARQYLGESPVGTSIRRPATRAGRKFANEGDDWQVVGVVDDMRQGGVDAPLQPEVFVSFAQIAPAALRELEPVIVLRTSRDPEPLVPLVRDLVREQAPGLVLDSVMTMEDRVMTSLWKPRLYAFVLGSFSSGALLIAGVGLFGVLAFSVAQRRREIGVRSALGADPRAIVWHVLRQALGIVGAGLVAGLAGAVALGRSLSAFLYGVSPYDALTLAAVAAVIIGVAAIACIVPATRAARMDPLTALRQG